MKGQTEKLTDAQLSKKLGSCQKAESIGMLLGIKQFGMISALTIKLERRK